jgi:serine phosphatase RsbU (regulator of sigma subunit)/ABC-type amino acid transport substrate-binding protein
MLPLLFHLMHSPDRLKKFFGRLHTRALILSLTVLFTFLSVPGQSAETLLVGYSENPPLVFTAENGKPAGLYVDIIQYIAKKEGWQLQFRPDQWNENLRKLDTGKINLLLDIGYSVARSKVYRFNQETLLEDWAQIYLAPDSSIISILDLDEKKIAMVKDDIHTIAFMQVALSLGIDANILETGNYQENETLLSTGKVDAIILPRIYARAKGDDTRFRTSPLMFNPIELCFAAPLNRDDDVLKKIDIHLRKLKGSPSSYYYRAMDRWIEGVQKIVLPQWLNPTWLITGIASLITLILLFTFLLKKQVRIQALALEKSIAEKQKQESELQVARSIQQGLLPAVPPDIAGYTLQALLQPAKAVGGDFYDYFILPDNKLCVLIADVADKGIPAALFMAAVKSFISLRAKDLQEIRQILTVVNRDVIASNDSCMFVTLFCGILDCQTNRLEYCLAGHEPPLLLRSDKTVERLEDAHCPALGIDEDSIYNSAETTLSPGDILFLFTDGVTETMNSTGELFGETRLQNMLLQDLIQDHDKLLKNVLQELERFAETKAQHDDITMLCLVREQ